MRNMKTYNIPNGLWCSLDPGQNTAIAYWQKGDLIGYSHYAGKGENWDEKVNSIVYQLDRALETTTPLSLFFENPSYFGQGAGKVAAQSGSLVKLTTLVGVVRALCVRRGIETVPVGVNEWKGQMSKQAVQKRVENRLGKPVDEVDHIVDAIGIGLFVQGKF